MDVQLTNVKFKRNIKIEHKIALSYVSWTKNTNPKWPFAHGVKQTSTDR